MNRKLLASPSALAAGCGLVLVANVVVLATAAWNRGGGPRALLTLTERELALPAYRQEENTSLLLTLMLATDPPEPVRRVALRKRYVLPVADEPWLDEGKLLELGVQAGREVATHVFVVLELEGDAWKRWLAAQEDRVRQLRREVEDRVAERGALADAEAVLALDRTMRSRLVPVDAGMDSKSLQDRYPDRERHVIVEGIVVPRSERGDGAEPRGASVELILGTIHVPSASRARLEKFLAKETRSEIAERERMGPGPSWPAPTPPRYRAAVAFGRRNEPWLVEITETAER